jgi:hypothetical protein
VPRRGSKYHVPFTVPSRHGAAAEHHTNTHALRLTTPRREEPHIFHSSAVSYVLCTCVLALAWCPLDRVEVGSGLGV